MAAEHVAGSMDKAVSSFIRAFEENYTRFEAAIRKRVDWTGGKRRRGGGGGKGAVAAAAADEWRGRDLRPRLGAAMAASSDAEVEGTDSEMS